MRVFGLVLIVLSFVLGGGFFYKNATQGDLVVSYDMGMGAIKKKINFRKPRFQKQFDLLMEQYGNMMDVDVRSSRFELTPEMSPVELRLVFKKDNTPIHDYERFTRYQYDFHKVKSFTQKQDDPVWGIEGKDVSLANHIVNDSFRAGHRIKSFEVDEKGTYFLRLTKPRKNKSETFYDLELQVYKNVEMLPVWVLYVSFFSLLTGIILLSASYFKRQSPQGLA